LSREANKMKKVFILAAIMIHRQGRY